MFSETCAICGKPTSRFWGVAATVAVEAASNRSVVEALGFCAQHREQVVAHWVTSLDDMGTVIWSSLASHPDHPLRVRDVPDFLRDAHLLISDALGGGAVVLPRDASGAYLCPHCHGALTMGTGPHAADAAQLGGTAWTCTRCGAAGAALNI